MNQLSNIQFQLLKLNETINKELKKINKRFNNIENRLSLVEYNLENINKSFNNKLKDNGLYQYHDIDYDYIESLQPPTYS